MTIIVTLLNGEKRGVFGPGADDEARRFAPKPKASTNRKVWRSTHRSSIASNGDQSRDFGSTLCVATVWLVVYIMMAIHYYSTALAE
jgi:hypothetical protein